MKRRNIKADQFTPMSSDCIMFDTNIMIDLFYPVNFSRRTNPYEKVYMDIRKKGSRLIISSVQISEFINKCIRIRFDLYNVNNDKNFKKDYRNTDDYKNNMNAILEIINHDIIPNFVFIDDGFTEMQNEKIFRYGASYDFNDALIAEIAKKNNAYLVTQDGDFFNYSSEITLVTENKALLMMA